MMGEAKRGRRSHRRRWKKQTHSTDEDAEDESTPSGGEPRHLVRGRSKKEEELTRVSKF